MSGEEEIYPKFPKDPTVLHRWCYEYRKVVNEKLKKYPDDKYLLEAKKNLDEAIELIEKGALVGKNSDLKE